MSYLKEDYFNLRERVGWNHEKDKWSSSLWAAINIVAPGVSYIPLDFIPTIYLHNQRSENLFKSMGFIKVNETKREKSYELDFR